MTNSTLYKKLLDHCQMMITMTEQQDWENFLLAEDKRQELMSKIQTEGDIKTTDKEELEKLIELNKQLETTAEKHRKKIQQELLKLQKGKKANTAYSQPEA